MNLTMVEAKAAPILVLFVFRAHDVVVDLVGNLGVG